jgi:nicotinamide mononucleotide transporter
MSPIEIIATLCGVANIILIIRRSVWNYPFALVMVSLYFLIFRDAKLYSDAGLQVFFFAVNLYGWRAWHRARTATGQIDVRALSGKAKAYCVIASIIAIAIWGTIMAHYTDASFPYWDGAIAMLSVAGQLLMTRRHLENWYYWIVVNAISIPLYIVKDLYLTAGLYFIFLAFAVAGLIEWRRVQRLRALDR